MFFRQKLPYIILGIGIGILLTNTVYSFYSKTESKDYTQEEIIEKAKELGMVFLKDAIKVDNTDENEWDKEEKPKEVQIVIEKGDVLDKIANNLYTAGLIDEVDEFKKYVYDRDLESKFRVGTYTLEAGIEYEEIIDILQKRKK